MNYNWLKFNLWLEKNRDLIMGVAACVIIVGLIVAAAFIFHETKEYYYIDFGGNKGIANWCQITENGLVCKTRDGVTKMVRQYWRK